MKITQRIKNFSLVLLLLNFSSFKLCALSQIWVFGDNFNDVGYQDHLSLPQQKKPIYTSPNGYIWITYLAGLLGRPVSVNNQNPPNGNKYVSGEKKGNDYAAGGATTMGIGIGKPGIYNPPSIDEQVTHYFAQHNKIADPDALYIIWGGVNDIFTSINKGDQKDVIELNALHAAGNIINAVQRLIAAGAQHVLVMNMPDLNITPYGQYLIDKDPSMKDALMGAADIFNKELGIEVQQFGLSILIFDDRDLLDYIYDYKEKLLANTTVHFSNVTTPSCNGSVQSISALTCFPPIENKDYLFDDGVYLTDSGNHVLALAVRLYLQAFESTVMLHKVK